jgi:hypothetical protein
MKRLRLGLSVSILFCSLLLAILPAVAQEMPAEILITGIDTSQFPEMEVYVDTFANDRSQQIGFFLFADTMSFTEDGSALKVSGVYDTPRGTSVTFLIDADSTAQQDWQAIKSTILSYAADPYMSEDWDYVSVIIANGQKTETLVDQTQFHNGVFNAFITDAGAEYVPSIVPTTPLADLIGDVLVDLEGPAPKEGMYRALVVLSSGELGNSQRSVEEVADLARESNIPLHTVLIGQDSAGQAVMEQLARISQGRSSSLDPTEDLTKLWQIISSHRQQYAISYRSQITSSGNHAVKVQLSDAVQSAFDFPITVEPPDVEITLPTANQVIPLEPADSDQPSGDQLTTLAVKYQWSWPDNHERDIQSVQLRVNGAVVQQLDLSTSQDRNLAWDIASLAPGPYSLRVEVVDELGLKGESAEVPVTLAAPSPAGVTATPTVEATPTPGPGVMSSVMDTVKSNLGCITVSGLSLGTLLVTVIAFRRRLSGLASSPIAYLRRMPIFRPVDSLLRNIERIVGPIRRRKPKAVQAPVATKPRAWLEVVQGHTTVRGPIPLEGEVSLGRSSDKAKITFSERTVSRLHTRVVPEHGGNFRVYNQSSQQTWVNEQQVPEHGLLLKNGDVIRMGQARVRFHTK